jgi:hypothetical protein
MVNKRPTACAIALRLRHVGRRNEQVLVANLRNIDRLPHGTRKPRCAIRQVVTTWPKNGAIPLALDQRGFRKTITCFGKARQGAMKPFKTIMIEPRRNTAIQRSRYSKSF